MNRKWLIASGAAAAGAAFALTRRSAAKPGLHLSEVFRDDTFQLTGVTVSRRNRLFVNYPRWSDMYLNAVVEIGPDGTARPFPDERWNGWDRKPQSARDHFVCVQSVVVDEDDMLWALDAAAPMLTSPVPGGAKLVQMDLTSNCVVRVIPFSDEVVRQDTYLNDVRFDLQAGVAYITDSGAGGIIVVDLSSGRARRTLDDHPSVKAELGVEIAIDGRPVRDARGRPPMFNSDGIALSSDRAYLYYQAITANTLYRIPTSVLRDRHATTEEIGTAVERYASTFPVDGLWIDACDRVYLTDITHTAVSRLLPGGTIERLAVDARLQWPDTFSEGPDGAMYVTASHINHSATYNGGKSVRRRPYTVFKFTPPA